MKKIFALTTLSIFILSGCSTDDPADGLVGDELQTPLVEIAEYIKVGDSQGFCRHVEVQFGVECPSSISPSLGVEDFEPEIIDLPSGQLFGFNTGGMTLDIERVDYEFEGETFYEWIVRDFSMPSLFLPGGGKYAGNQISKGSSLSLMPGGINESLLELTTDANGFWEANLSSDGRVSYKLAPDSITRVTQAFEDSCADYSSKLKASDLLSPASTFLGGKAGQEENAVRIEYVNPGSTESESRVLNFPKVTSASCSIIEGSVEVDDTGSGIQNFSGMATIEILLEGDVEMLVDKDYVRGIYTYEWLPRKFQATLQLSSLLDVSGEENTFIWNQQPSLSKPWMIDEPVVDLYDGP